MGDLQALRCYAYVNRRYEDVRALVAKHPLDLFQRATNSAAERARSIAATLRVGVAGIVVGVDVRIEVGVIDQAPGPAGVAETTRINLGWTATRGGGLFPAMFARLTVWPLSAEETQLELDGAYKPPLGVLGDVFDAAIGHRIAEASVKHFLDDLVEQLRREPQGER